MVAPTITDDEIIALYLAGTAIKAIPAGEERINRVLLRAGIPKRSPVNASAKARAESVARRNAAIVADFRAGITDRDALAHRHGCTPRTVQTALLAAGEGKSEVRPNPWRPLRAVTPPPELGDPSRATGLRRKLIERANTAKLDAWRAAA